MDAVYAKALEIARTTWRKGSNIDRNVTELAVLLEVLRDAGVGTDDITALWEQTYVNYRRGGGRAGWRMLFADHATPHERNRHR